MKFVTNNDCNLMIKSFAIAVNPDEFIESYVSVGVFIKEMLNADTTVDWYVFSSAKLIR